jgi:hypothetical protein
MYFLLHYQTDGILMNASNRHDMLSWSERQLSIRVRRISVLECNEPFAEDEVEKSGTGIRASNGERAIGPQRTH